MSRSIQDITGNKYGRLTVLEFHGKVKSSYLWKCVCECGKECLANRKGLICGDNKSCGCLQRESTIKRARRDLVGQRFGRLVVIEFDKSTPQKNGKNYDIFWKCKCDCGNDKTTTGHLLKTGSTKSCGCWMREQASERAKTKEYFLPGQSHPHFRDLTGQVFNRWTVLQFGQMQNKVSRWLCQCECGTERLVNGSTLTQGTSRSCGCLLDEMQSGTDIQKNRRWYFITKNGEKRRCRSSYEVLYANWLTENNINFEYEPKRLRLTGNITYLPDFYLPNEDLWIELKGKWTEGQEEKVALFAQQYKIRVMYYEDIRRECGLKYKYATSYGQYARKHNIPLEDYLGQKLYYNKENIPCQAVH